MKYLSEERVAKSWDLLRSQGIQNNQQLTKFFGLLEVIANSDSPEGKELMPRVQYEIEKSKLAESLQKRYFFGEESKSFSYDGKYYLILSECWGESLFKYFLNSCQLSILEVACVLMYSETFEENANAADVVSLFKKRYRIGVSSNIFFSYQYDEQDIVFIATPFNKRSLYDRLLKALNVVDEGEKYTVIFDGDGLVKANAGELSRAPFIQTLYAFAGSQKYYLLADAELAELYGMKRASDVAADNDRHSNVQTISQESVLSNALILPKPFLLLAGISGTGKTRYFLKQAEFSAVLVAMHNGHNYCLISVRPDWHEPSDLLGYISRIGTDGPKYVVTDLLRFIVASWKHAISTVSADSIEYKPFEQISPFWLCLDEMNLAPVEQYFADYLSVLETREWDGDSYRCDPLLKPDVIELLGDAQGAFWMDLRIDGEEDEGLRDYFKVKGISLPPNLIVAGTVNMDETTHGFSRKVIDRALTIDFGEFFPNNYDQFFLDDLKAQLKPLTYSRISAIRVKSDLSDVQADPDGSKTVSFLDSVNKALCGTPFQLAYRALNEALLSVKCFNPSNKIELQAIWDDFLMMKVLPRIEGDAEKLSYEGEETGILNLLIEKLETELPEINKGEARPDLFRVNRNDQPIMIQCRSLRKLKWMQARLEKNGFSSFWP